MQISNNKILEILVASERFDKAELKKYQKEAEKAEQSLYDYLLVNELIPHAELGGIIANYYHVKFIDLYETEIDEDALQIIPEVVAKQNDVIAFDRDAGGVHIAIADPGNEEFIKNFQKRSEEPVNIYFADKESILYALQESAKSDQEEFGALIQNIIDFHADNPKTATIPIIKIVNKMLKLGYINKASDIHIEPFEKYTLIRFRIDGILHDIVKIPPKIHDLVVTRLKILSRLRTDEHRAAQDGKLRFPFNKQKIDVRVSIVPVVHGEKVVMRILAERSRQYDLENLGFSEKDLSAINSNIKRPWGMILTTGPTGCGKTTTLYSILKKLNTREVNISTIEDPVEYDMEGINQIQTNPKTGLTFASGLRSIVR